LLDPVERSILHESNWIIWGKIYAVAESMITLQLIWNFELARRHTCAAKFLFVTAKQAFGLSASWASQGSARALPWIAPAGQTIFREHPL
jgi:hypothetical protein